MPFEWAEFLTLATHLTESEGIPVSRECLLRCAVSRAYYAAFCTMRNRAVEEGFVSSGTAADHVTLVEHLRSHRRYREAARLSRLRQWRNQCDYDDNVRSLEQMWDSALQYALLLIEA